MKFFRMRYRLALTYLIANGSLLTTACTSLQLKEAVSTSTNSSALPNSQNQAFNPNNTEKIKIDWPLLYPDSIASLTKQTKTTGQNSEYLSTEQLKLINIDYIYRKQIALDSLEYNYAVEQLAKQLEGRLFDSYWSSDEDKAKLFLITRLDVVADEHDYIFRHGNLAGFVVSFVVLPIADRNVEDMLAVYSGDNWLPIEQLIAEYNGELQAIGYQPKDFLIEADAYFPEPLPSDTQIKQLEAELRMLTGVTITVRKASKLIF